MRAICERYQLLLGFIVLLLIGNCAKVLQIRTKIKYNMTELVKSILIYMDI